MDKKSEEYLRQYIKLTDTIKQKIEAHAARYHIKAEIASRYSGGFFLFFYQTIILIYESSAMMERRYICIHCSIFNDVNHNINIVQKGDIL